MTTLKDIAEKTGYSITTVSRALAGYDDVNEQTRQHILKIAGDMAYQPNIVARQLRNQKTDTIGLILPPSARQFSDDFFSELLMGAGYMAAQLDYDLLVSAPTSNNEMQTYRRFVGGNRVDGILLARTYREDPRIAYLKQMNHPFVVSGRRSPDEESDFPYIDVDSQLGIRQIVNHLTRLGHQNIAVLLPPPKIAYTPYRLAGYQQGLADANLPYREDYVIYSDLRREGGYQSAGQMIDAHPEVSAIVACNDPMALGAMMALQERGIVVGRDVAVTGFDDINDAEYAKPPLTTVRQPIHEIGQQLIQMLVQIIRQEAPAQSQILLSPELIVRESCGAKL